MGWGEGIRRRIARIACVLACIALARLSSAAGEDIVLSGACLSLTEGERALVAASQRAPITVGIIPSSAPACYWDEEQGKYVGIYLDVLDAISAHTGLAFEYVGLDLSQGSPIQQLKSGAPTLVAGILKTPEFAADAELVLSSELIHDSLVLVGRRGDDFTRDGANKTIAISSGFQAAAEYVAQQFPQHRTVRYADIDACLNAVRSGEADATLYMRTCLSYILQDPHYEKLEILPAFTKDVVTCAAGLSAGQTELIDLIDKGLSSISESDRNSMLMNFTIMNPYRMSTKDMLYKYRAPLIASGFLVMVVIGGLLLVNAGKRRSEIKLQAAYAHEQAAHEKEKQALTVAEKASAAKGNFMSRMSHEIRTPLNAVIGYNTIARNEMAAAKTDAERRRADMKVMDCLTKSEMASKHLLTIINDVLDMSAIESGRIVVARERFDFKGLITSLTALFYTQARAKGVAFEVVLDTLTEEWFVGDQMRVNQILTNLLSNAVKFTSDGGSVRLSIHQPEAEKNAAHIHFEVADTGIGMAPEYLYRIWTPFEQADTSIARRFGGTGLGLSITKTLVELMGGKIAVKSAPGVGTTFSVDLTFERTQQQSHSKTYEFGGIKALVADDDENTCDYVRLLFTRCGARCVTVTSGQEALDAYAYAMDRKEPFTLCLIDWQMPGMNGVETVRRIRGIAGDTVPIIILSAYDDSEIAEAAKKVGVNMFISKPLFQSSLFDILANIVGDRDVVKLKPSRQYNFSGKRVLLAEDNAMNMEVARRVLESTGLGVDGALNGKLAAEAFMSSPVGTYDAILMDVQMPEMDGHQATRVIRASGHPEAKTIPIIAMTADAFAENVRDALAAGMNNHVAKPIEPAILFAALARAFRGED